LTDPRHQKTIAALYLSVAGGQDYEELIERADSFRYWHDGDVSITVAMPGGDGEFWPDAVYKSERTQVFVEVDRSTKSGVRIEKTIKRYAALAAGFGVKGPFDGSRSVRLLFVTKSGARAKNLGALTTRANLRGLDLVALPFLPAVDWLRKEVLGDTPDDQPQIAARLDHFMTEVTSLIVARDAGNPIPGRPALEDISRVRRLLGGICAE